MKQLIRVPDYLPIPLPHEDVHKVREWLSRVIPLSACEELIRSITDVTYDCGPDAPQWVRKLARRTASARPRPIDVQVCGYSAMVQLPTDQAFERIFEMSFTSNTDALLDAPLRFQKYL